MLSLQFLFVFKTYKLSYIYCFFLALNSTCIGGLFKVLIILITVEVLVM